MIKFVRILRRDLLPVLIMVLLVLSVRSSLADHYVVPTGSMEYTLLPGDRIMVNKLAYGLRVPFLDSYLTRWTQPTPGEIVIFDSPQGGDRLVKRVVAVGGDHIIVRQGHLWVNGQATWAVENPEIEQLGHRRVKLNLSRGGGPQFGPATIPDGFVMVMGDFRGNSHDSRGFGLLPQEAIYARALSVYWRQGQGPVWKPL